MIFRIAIMCFALLGALASAVPANVGVGRAIQRSGRAHVAATPYPYARMPHIFFGTIVRVYPTALTLRLRNGRILLVDITAALRDGTYSAPLVPGRAVAVEGRSGVGGRLDAVRLTRVTRIDGSTQADR